MCKKIITVLLSLIFVFFIYVPSEAQASIPQVNAQASILMIAGSNEILYSKNAEKRLSMASTTKIMTAILAIEYGDFDKEITVTDKMVRIEGTSSGLLAGDKIDLKTLLYCMMLQSGNDAANVTAYAVCGSIEKFVETMNKKAKEIGMRNTHFSTVSGLDADEHYSTAYDMAILTSYALGNSLFKEVCSTYTKTVSYGNPKYERKITNHNKLLKSYDGMIGVKTGFTKKSGRCLVTAAERDGLTLICVTLNDGFSDWNEHCKLLDYGFEKAVKIPLCIDELPKISVVGSSKKQVVSAFSEKPEVFTTEKAYKYSYKIEIEQFLYAPVYKNDIVGKVKFYDKNGYVIAETPLISCENAELSEVVDNGKKELILKRILRYFKEKNNVR